MQFLSVLALKNSCCVSLSFTLVISTELDELMMEAQLLQVSLPEIQELYQTLFTKQSPALQPEQKSPSAATNEKASVQQQHSAGAPWARALPQPMGFTGVCVCGCTSMKIHFPCSKGVKNLIRN